jgi:hypothetical protein
MPAIHLLCRAKRQTPSSFQNLGHPTYLTGWWKVPLVTARGLIGGTIYLHNTKQDPSRMGGEILDVVQAPPGEPKDRVGFVFRSTRSGRGGPWDWGPNTPNPNSEQSVIP